MGLEGSYSIDATKRFPTGYLTAQAEQDDLSGNTGLSAPNTFTVDTEAPPSPTIDSSPPDPSDSANASFSFSDSEAGVSFSLRARRRRLQRLQLAAELQRSWRGRT